MLAHRLAFALIGVTIVAPSSSAQTIPQPLALSTVAGTPATCALVDGLKDAARFCRPTKLARDAAGNLYVSDHYNKVIRKIDGHGQVTTVARVSSEAPSAGRGSDVMTVDASGNIYMANTGGIFKLGRDGTDAKLSDTGVGFQQVGGLAVDSSGNLYLATTCLVYKVSPAGSSTILAGGTCGHNDGIGTAARFSRHLYDVAVDTAGNVYVGEFENGSVTPGVIEDRVRKITPAGVVSTLARVTGPWPMDIVSASRHSFSGGLAVDDNGNVYFSASTCWSGDMQSTRHDRNTVCDATIRKITTAGIITTIAGYSGDAADADGPLSAARFIVPTGIVLDASGDLVVADSSSSVIRKISLRAGVVTTIAGRRSRAGGLSGSVAAVDRSGTVYDIGFDGVLRKTLSNGQTTTIAGLRLVGGPLAGFNEASFDGVGIDARFHIPTSIGVDSAGLVYVIDAYGLRRVTADGSVNTIAPATPFSTPVRLTIDGFDNVYVTSRDSSTTPARFWVEQLMSGKLVAISPVSVNNVFAPGSTPMLVGLGIASGGHNLYVTDQNAVYQIETDHNHRRSLIAGDPASAVHADGPGNVARFSFPGSLAVDGSGHIYVSDDGDCTIRVIHSGFQVTTVTPGVCGELLSDKQGNVYVVGRGGPLRVSFNGTSAATEPWSPSRVAHLANFYADGVGGAARFGASLASPTVDVNGNIFVADTLATIRKVTPAGVVSTLAGEPLAHGGSNDGVGVTAHFGELVGLAVDGGGTLYGADRFNHTIRKISPAGVVTTLAGAAGQAGNNDGIGGAARFTRPVAIAVENVGTVYVAANGAVRKIDTQGVVSTFAGASGDLGHADGAAGVARLGELAGITVDGTGNVFVVDGGFGTGQRGTTVRKITPDGSVTTLAGSPTASGYADGPGSSARFLGAGSVTVDAHRNLYVADGACTIRKITPAGDVTTVAGHPPTPFFFADWDTYCGYVDSAGVNARLGHAGIGLAADAAGNIWIADAYNNVVRKGVAAVSPSVTSHPSNASVRAGQTATFAVTATGSPIVTYRWQGSSDRGASWQNLPSGPPYMGQMSATLTVAAVASLAGYQFRCVVDNGSTPAASNAATLSVLSPLSASPSALQFGATKAAGSATLGSITPAQQIAIAQSNSGSWSVTTSPAWLQITGGSGAASGSMTVSLVNPNNVIGDSTALSSAIVVTSSADASLPLTIPVTLTVTRPSQSAAPFGSFDTPGNGATVAGSIAVTGWALDDIAIDRVEIWRDRAPGETTPVYTGGGLGNGKIFIATPLFISGARPDVAAAFPTIPQRELAGWGYLLLTQGLWNQGNGPFTLYAFAYDKDGRSANIGTKTITSDNVQATRPFGGIDVPSYGQTVSGAFWNFGWALTPNATPQCRIGASGVQMSIDSAPLQPVSYGALRPDIAAAFPGFTNGAGAGGAFFIDTSTLTNGTHQIGWYVVDDCQRADGIGSRFFTVLNQGSGISDQGSGDAVAASSPMPAERRKVSIRQGERVEIALPLDGGLASGYQIINGERRALPLGSSLDAAAGMFYWEPAPGFLGAYDLEFVGVRGDAIAVRAIVGTAVQAVIDTPRSGRVESTFTIAGWAIDEAANEGPGIDAVHVWAYPADGGAPIFLGVAAIGDERPDIAARFGDQFAGSSYSLNVTLAPGIYDVVVYPHSAVARDFHGAKVVRVTVR